MRTRISRKFNRCVKSVKKTVRARKGSNKESAAIAICTKSVLQTRGRTLKSYSRKRLITQKKFKGGVWPFGPEQTLAPRRAVAAPSSSVAAQTYANIYSDPTKGKKGRELLISLANQVKEKAKNARTPTDVLAEQAFTVDSEGMDWIRAALNEYRKNYPVKPDSLSGDIRQKLGFTNLEDDIQTIRSGRGSLAKFGVFTLAAIEVVKKLDGQSGGDEDDDRTTAEVQNLLVSAGDMLLVVVIGIFKILGFVLQGGLTIIGSILGAVFGF